MGRVVIVDTGWQSLAVPGTGAAALDLLEIKLGSTQFGYLMAAFIFQHSLETITKLEQTKVAIKRASGSYTTGLGFGTAPTIVKGATGDAAHGFATTKMLSSTQAVAGAGSLDTMMRGDFNISAGEWERTYIPELRPPIAASEAIILSIEEALEETMTVCGMLIFDIYG